MIEAIIDLSHWQADPDWAALEANGIAAVMLKGTQGSDWTDPVFHARANAAAAAGLRVGAYHFCDASPPADQVAHFLSVAATVSVLALDIEPNGMGGTVSIAQAAEMAARIAVARARPPLVYIGRYGPSGTGAGLPNSVLARCPLWLPDYTPASEPSCPSGWSAWTFWQYTNAGTVAGANGAVDRSRFIGSLDEFFLWWHPRP